MTSSELVDNFGRKITYLRLSVTDRCDLRCTYCMAENMTFLPKKDVLSLEELGAVASAFVSRGVDKIRITGGEPLVRKDIATLMKQLGKKVEKGDLQELTLTTNGTLLSHHAAMLADIGVKRINVSLDTLDDDTFEKLTRRRALRDVLSGIDAALSVGLKVKINTVALRNLNSTAIPAMIEWAHQRSMDLTLIEVMPLGEIDIDRMDQYIPLTEIRDELDSRWTLEDLDERTGGPARYVKLRETGGKVGFITPLTNNFCAGCNRVRVTCTGQLYTCLGHGDRLDLRRALRGPDPETDLGDVLDLAMLKKPERHFFDISERKAAPAVERHMSVTGG